MLTRLTMYDFRRGRVRGLERLSLFSKFEMKKDPKKSEYADRINVIVTKVTVLNEL